jgi:hypothetical protein
MDSMTKQRREGEANRPKRAKTGQRKLNQPSWTEFVRLADQAVVAFAGADMINRAEPRACGMADTTDQRDCKGIAREGYQTPGQGRTWGEWEGIEANPRRGRGRPGPGESHLPAVLGKTHRTG